MKKLKIAMLGLAALISGASAFTAKHAANNKFVQTYYLLATSGIGIIYYLITLSIKLCPGGSNACSGHIRVLGSTIITSSGGSNRTWVQVANFAVTGKKS